MSPRIRAGRAGEQGSGTATRSKLQQWWRQPRHRGSGSSGSSGGSDASVVVMRPPAGKPAPAATEPPAEGQQGRASSFARARASFHAAAQQARDMMAGLRNFMINPLAVPAPEPVGCPPPAFYPESMPPTPHHAAYAAPFGYPAPYASPLLPPQQGMPAAGGWPAPTAGGSPLLALPPPGGMMPPSAYSPPMPAPMTLASPMPPSPLARPMLLPPPVRTQQGQRLPAQQQHPQQTGQQVRALGPAAGAPVGATSAPPGAGASGVPASSAAVADVQQRLQQIQQQRLLVQQARQQGLAAPGRPGAPLPSAHGPAPAAAKPHAGPS